MLCLFSVGSCCVHIFSVVVGVVLLFVFAYVFNAVLCILSCLNNYCSVCIVV